MLRFGYRFFLVTYQGAVLHTRRGLFSAALNFVMFTGDRANTHAGDA